MIYNDKQFTISKLLLSKLKKAHEVAETRAPNPHWLNKAEIDSLHSQIIDIEAEIKEYTRNKSMPLSSFTTYSFAELPSILVKARIASGITQARLAKYLHIDTLQLQQLEATDYSHTPNSIMMEIAKFLGIKASEASATDCGTVILADAFKGIDWEKLPYKEMIKRKWFDVPRGSNPIEFAKEYFLKAAGPQFASAYHRKKVRCGKKPSEMPLIAWQMRILEKARDTINKQIIGSFTMNREWLPELITLSQKADGPIRARSLLADNGIILVVERHLPESYLDGAAMLLDGKIPIIGLTLRFDRLDNFWFVLMHELGHVFLHLFNELHYDFFDDNDATSTDSLEEDADRFSLETLISSNAWDQCLSRFALSEEAVLLDANTIGINPSIVAGRIRKERGDYTILSSLLGQDKVRLQFEEKANDSD